MEKKVKLLILLVMATLVVGSPMLEAKGKGSRYKSASSWSRPAPKYSAPKSGYKTTTSTSNIKATPTTYSSTKTSYKTTTSNIKAPPTTYNSTKTGYKTNSSTSNIETVSTTYGAPKASSTTKVKAPSTGQSENPPPTATVKVPKGTLNLNQSKLSKAEKAQARSASLKSTQTKQTEIEKRRQSNDYQTTTGGKSYRPSEIKSVREKYYVRYSEPTYRRYNSFFSNRSYGGFDGGWLSTILIAEAMGREGGDAMMWYALTGSPAIAVFMSDAKEVAIRNNDDVLLSRIEEIESENNRLKAQGEQPESLAAVMNQRGIPPEVAFTTNLLTGKDSVELTVSTGGVGGVYNTLCTGKPEVGFKGLKAIGDEYGISINCESSGGGNDNLKRAMRGETGAFPVQADNLFAYKQSGIDFGSNEFVMYQEPFLLLTGKKSNIDELTDIDKNTTVYVVGGATISWQVLTSFAADDTFLGFGGNQDYAQARVIKAPNWEDAIRAVEKDKNAILFVVMSVNAQKIKDIDENNGDALRLVTINDDRFLSIEDNGARVYAECHIPGDALPHLQAGSWWGTNDTTTLCTDALFVVNQDWVTSQDKRTQSLVGMMVLEMLEETPYIATRLDY